MSRRVALFASFLAVAILCLPVYAAAVRNRAQGAYNFRLTGTETIAGQTHNSRDTGTLTLAGTRIRGQSSDGEVNFNLRLANRVNNQTPQKTQAAGNLVIRESEGTSKGKLMANVRIQKTRVGTWKVTVNYAGAVTSGVLKGGIVTGKMVAKSN